MKTAKKLTRSGALPPCIQHVKLIAWLRKSGACNAARYWVGDPYADMPPRSFGDHRLGRPRSLKKIWQDRAKTLPDHVLRQWRVWLLDCVDPKWWFDPDPGASWEDVHAFLKRKKLPFV